MSHRTQRLGAILLATSILAGCGSSSDIVAPPPAPPPPVAVRQEDQFGTNFGIAFRASVTGEALAVSDGDIIPLSLTTEPVQVG